MSAPARSLYVPEPDDPPRADPRAFRHAAPKAPSARPAGPRTAPRGGSRPGEPRRRGPGGPGGPSGPTPPSGPPRRTAAPLALRLALLPLRLLVIPLRLAGLVLGRITGGRPWLALVLVLGCGVIFVHAATLQVNQQIEKRDQEISALERSTAELRNSVAELGSTDRISRIGREAGMVFPDPEGIGYLSARKSSAEKAAETFGPPAATWQPAPNPSTQNGDVLNDDGTLATSGTEAAAGGTEAAAGAAAAAGDATSGTTTGQAETPPEAVDAGTGTTPSTDAGG